MTYFYYNIHLYYKSIQTLARLGRLCSHLSNGVFPILVCYEISDQRRYWLGNFAWRVEITFARDTKIEVIDGEFLLCNLSVYLSSVRVSSIYNQHQSGAKTSES